MSLLHSVAARFPAPHTPPGAPAPCTARSPAAAPRLSRRPSPAARPQLPPLNLRPDHSAANSVGKRVATLTPGSVTLSAGCSYQPANPQALAGTAAAPSNTFRNSSSLSRVSDVVKTLALPINGLSPSST